MSASKKQMRREMLERETRIGKDISYALHCLEEGEHKRCRPDTARDTLRGALAYLGRPESWHGRGGVRHR